jgi:GDPmannose 4,6-dehydratase
VKALIFGANGQTGHYLAEALRDRNVDVIGVSRSGAGVRGDVSRWPEVEGLVREHRPAYIFHLAARSTTRHEALFENHETISTGTLNVLEAAHRHCPEARVFITGSGVQFRNEGAPIDERAPFEASSAYAVARIQSTFAARYYRGLGLRSFVGHLFHHESPLRKPGHLSRLITTAVKRIASGSNETLELGDTSVVKEWTFAGDTASGILRLVDQDEVSEAVIGSGEGHSVEEWLTQCFSLVGRSWRDHVRLKPGFRPEYSRLISAPARLRELGWRPLVTFEALAAMMMNAEP